MSGVLGVLRNKPRSRFERFFSFRLWQSSSTLEVRVREREPARAPDPG